MQIILLSGGSGKRLWPLSNNVRSKQFLKLLEDGHGNRQSMAQRVYAQIKEAQPNAAITIATNAAQLDSIRNQLGDSVRVVIEPERRDTFPAILLACGYLALEKNISYDETVIVLPVDPFTELGFFGALTRLDKLVSSTAADIALIGIKPLLPTSKYGYIVPGAEIAPNAFLVSQFVEKPDEKTAGELIDDGAYWNGGAFAFKLGYMMGIARENANFANYGELHSKYGELEKTSFDYKVVEKASHVAVVPYNGKWADIGTWRTLTDEMPASALGNVVSQHTRNTFVVNELGIPVVALGTKDVIIAASPDGILVSDLIESSQLKPIVDKLEHARPMYEEMHWGNYTVVAQDRESLVRKMSLLAGKSISCQPGQCRGHVWVVTSGCGELSLGNKTQKLAAGDVAKIARGQNYKLTATSDMQITEVQIGGRFDEGNVVRFSPEEGP